MLKLLQFTNVEERSVGEWIVISEILEGLYQSCINIQVRAVNGRVNVTVTAAGVTSYLSQ